MPSTPSTAAGAAGGAEELAGSASIIAFTRAVSSKRCPAAFAVFSAQPMSPPLLDFVQAAFWAEYASRVRSLRPRPGRPRAAAVDARPSGRVGIFILAKWSLVVLPLFSFTAALFTVNLESLQSTTHHLQTVPLIAYFALTSCFTTRFYRPCVPSSSRRFTVA